MVVNTIADSTDPAGSKTVSLRDAINIANANASTTPTTITFSPTAFATAETITIGSPLQFSGTTPTTITGSPAGVTISGNNKVQGIVVDSGVTLTLTDLTITKCNASLGAGIDDGGTLTLTDSTLSFNDATSNDDGGGIAITGTATLINDTIANNIGDGMNPRGGTTLIEDSTITGNSSYGGYPAGGIYVQGSAVVTVANSIIAGNTAASGASDVEGSYVSKGHNIVGATDDSNGWISSDQTGTVAHLLSPKLGALASNGGPTETCLPLTGSPAIAKGSISLIPSGVTTDQRGAPRTFNGAVDVGSVELQPAIAVTAPGKQAAVEGKSTSVSLGSFSEFGGTAPYKLDVNWGDGSADTIVSLTAAGTIPATSHTFAKAGSLTVTETITDAKGNKSNVATFTDVVTAPLGSISGEVFNDGNGDGKLDGGEFGMGLWTVYIDLKNTGSFAAGDPTSTTNVFGNWSFTNLAAGTYVIRIEPVNGAVATTPTVLTIKLTAGQVSTGNLFGEKAIA